MSTNSPARVAGTNGTVVSIHLGATSVRVVELEWTRVGSTTSGSRIARRGSAPLSPTVWNDLMANRDVLTVALKQALASAGIIARNVVACLPRRLVTLRFVRLPHAPPEELRGMIAFEAQQYILFSLDEVILDYRVLSGPANLAAGTEDLDTILLAAARRDLVTALMSSFDAAGLELTQLSVSALGLAENIRDSMDPTALIDIEPGEMDVAVIADGKLVFTRAGVLDTHGVQDEVAERRIVEEVARSFTSYQNEFRNRPLAQVWMSGATVVGANGGRVERALADVLELTAAPLNTRLLPANDPEARAYATATGMALQALEGSVASINLVPSERAELRASLVRNRRQRLIGLVAACAAAAATFYVWGFMKRQTVLQAQTREANDKLADLETRLKKRQKEFDDVSTRSKDLITGLDRDHPTVDVFAALNGALPRSADIWLTQFSFERGGLLSLRGDTKAATAATALVLALQRSGAFRDVRLSYLGDAQESDSAALAPPPKTAPARPATGTPAPANPLAANPLPINPLPGMAPRVPGGPGAPGPTFPGAGGPGMGGGRGLNPGFNPGVPPNGQNPQAPSSFTPGGPPPGFTPGAAPRIFTPGNTPSPTSAPGVAPPSTFVVPLQPPKGAPQNSGDMRRGPLQNALQTIKTVPTGATVRSAEVKSTVPTISTPPGGIQPATPVQRPAAGTKAGQAAKQNRTQGGKPQLTSFMITCRINTQAKTLIPAGAGKESHEAQPQKGANTSHKSQNSTTIDSSNTDDGGDDAGTQ